MGYKFCDYLLANYTVNGDLILYNTLYHTTSLIYKKYLDIFDDLRKQILRNGSYIGNTQNIDLLLDSKIIFDNNYNFDKDLDCVYENTINNPKTLNLTILPTEKCNFRCIYCYEDFTHDKMNNEIIHSIGLLLDELVPRYNSLYISWFGGEPLLALDVIEQITQRAVSLSKKHKKPFCAGITTNGYLLDASLVKKLIKWHVLSYQITIDGNEVTHNKQRPLQNGSGTYSTILNNLLDIKNKVKTHAVKFIVRINVSDDISSRDIEIISELFKDDKRFLINPQHVFETARYHPESNNYNNYIDKLKSCGFVLHESLLPEDTICYASKNNSLLIRSNGSLGKCTVNLNDSSNNFDNITEINFSNFDLKKIHFSHSEHKVELCKKCPVYPLCFGMQCAYRRKQLCGEIIDKYSLIIRSFEHNANIIYLR